VLRYLATIGGFYLLVGLVLLAGAGVVSELGGGGALSTTPAYVVQAVVGLALIALSFRYDKGPVLRRRARRGGRPSRVERWREAVVGEEATWRATVVVALGAGLVEVASMLPYLAAIGILTTSRVSVQGAALVLAGYVLVMVLPALVLLAVRRVAGTRADRPLEQVRDWLVRHTQGSLGWVIGVVGLLLLLAAVSELAARGVFGG